MMAFGGGMGGFCGGHDSWDEFMVVSVCGGESFEFHRGGVVAYFYSHLFIFPILPWCVLVHKLLVCVSYNLPKKTNKNI